jgi:SAM-dependent methyltransferase
MTNVEFDPGSFDAVVAFYALIHVPRDEQAALLGRIAGWLRPKGFLFATLGVGDDPGTVEEDWLGSPMFFSHFDAQGNRAMVAAAGLTVEIAEVRNEEEHGEPVPFLWVLARKPVTPPRASRPSRTPHGPEGGR